MDSGTRDGFELEASVWKGIAKLNATLSPTTAKTVKTLQPTPTTSKLNKFRVGELPVSIPSNVRDQLEQWMSVHGRKLPPCICYTNKTLIHHSSAGKPAVWWHVNGEKLELSLHLIRNNGVDTTAEPRILVASSNGVAPIVVRYKGSIQQEAIGYRIWHGINGDQLGFETGCSVFKVINGKTPSLDDLTRWHSIGQAGGMTVPKERTLPQPISATTSINIGRFRGNAFVDRHGVARKGKKSLRPRDSITRPAKFLPSNLAETKRPDYVPVHK